MLRRHSQTLKEYFLAFVILKVKSLKSNDLWGFNPYIYLTDLREKKLKELTHKFSGVAVVIEHGSVKLT